MKWIWILILMTRTRYRGCGRNSRRAIASAISLNRLIIKIDEGRYWYRIDAFLEMFLSDQPTAMFEMTGEF